MEVASISVSGSFGQTIHRPAKLEKVESFPTHRAQLATEPAKVLFEPYPSTLASGELVFAIGDLLDLVCPDLIGDYSCLTVLGGEVAERGLELFVSNKGPHRKFCDGEVQGFDFVGEARFISVFEVDRTEELSNARSALLDASSNCRDIAIERCRNLEDSHMTVDPRLKILALDFYEINTRSKDEAVVEGERVEGRSGFEVSWAKTGEGGRIDPDLAWLVGVSANGVAGEVIEIGLRYLLSAQRTGGDQRNDDDAGKGCSERARDRTGHRRLSAGRGPA